MFCLKVLMQGVLAIFLLVVLPVQAEEWKHEFTPYVWMSDLKTTAGAGGSAASATSDMDFFDDLLPLVDAGWMHMYEGRKGNLSIMNEVVYMKVSEGVSATGPLAFVSASVKGVFEQGTVDLMAGYTPDNSNTTFYGGLRYIFLGLDVDTSVSVVPPGAVVKSNGQRSENWIDPVIGVRQIMPINEHMVATLKVDVGGGLDSKFSSISTLGIKYALSDTLNLLAGYRYARIDKDDSDILFDQTAKGLLVGVGFEF